MADPFNYEERERMRRQEANWNALPIVLGVAFLLALGFLLLSDTTNPPDRSSSVDAPQTTPR